MSLTCLSGPTIPAGSALSEGIDVSAGRIINLIMPSQWSGGACLSFLVSTDDTIFNDLFGIQITTDTFMPFESILAPIIPGACCVMPLGTGSDMAWIKLRSGTSQLPISQQADRTFQIVLELARCDVSCGLSGSACTPPVSKPSRCMFGRL